MKQWSDAAFPYNVSQITWLYFFFSSIATPVSRFLFLEIHRSTAEIKRNSLSDKIFLMKFKDFVFESFAATCCLSTWLKSLPYPFYLYWIECIATSRSTYQWWMTYQGRVMYKSSEGCIREYPYLTRDARTVVCISICGWSSIPNNIRNFQSSF